MWAEAREVTGPPCAGAEHKDKVLCLGGGYLNPYNPALCDPSYSGRRANGGGCRNPVEG